MKIAVSGAHRTGKTTLIDALADALPSFEVFEEPYHELAGEGHVFTQMPSLEDFELQLERSVESILENEGDCLFDRCPLDIIAYLYTHSDSKAFDFEPWRQRVEDALRRLDLIVYVPIEDPDRIVVSDYDDLRRRVDYELIKVLEEDEWDFSLGVLEVCGSPGERAQQVLMDINNKNSVYRIQ